MYEQHTPSNKKVFRNSITGLLPITTDDLHASVTDCTPYFFLYHLIRAETVAIVATPAITIFESVFIKILTDYFTVRRL